MFLFPIRFRERLGGEMSTREIEPCWRRCEEITGRLPRYLDGISWMARSLLARFTSEYCWVYEALSSKLTGFRLERALRRLVSGSSREFSESCDLFCHFRQSLVDLEMDSVRFIVSILLEFSCLYAR